MECIKKVSIVLSVLAVISSCHGYSYLQQQIPNGEMVPHPCKPNYLWRGVGHENHLGGGPRNAFGVDFKANKFVWDATICNKDSDGDGKTNGEELGDPDCTWTPGNEPKRRAGLSHPGICDPFDNPRCSGQPEFVDCNTLEFKCDALDQPGTKNFTIRFPETKVPAEETTYECMMFDFPELDGIEHHIVAHTPHIDNVDVMHHILVYGCTGNVSQPRNQPYVCDMGVGDNCPDIIGMWTVGMSGNCLHPNTGFLIGGTQGYQTAAIQAHWNNPLKRSDYKDSSGLTFHVTSKLRPNNAGVLMIGQRYLQLPPGRDSYGVFGGCDGDCTPSILSGDISVVAAFNHMHYLGSAQTTQLFRNGEKVSNLAMDPTYSYDFPIMYDHATPIVVKPGDELQTTCVYKTTSRTKTTFYGDSTSAEMCFAFLIYYPKDNVNIPVCTTWKGLSFCERHFEKTKDGCDFQKLGDLEDPKVMGVYVNLTNKCQRHTCLEECKNYVRELRRKNPCFKGQNFDWIRATSRGNEEAEMILANAASCDVQLALERDDPTSASNVLTSLSLSIVITMAFVIRFI